MYKSPVYETIIPYYGNDFLAGKNEAPLSESRRLPFGEPHVSGPLGSDVMALPTQLILGSCSSAALWVVTLHLHLCLARGLELTNATLGIFPGIMCLLESGADSSWGPSPPLTPIIDYMLKENACRE